MKKTKLKLLLAFIVTTSLFFTSCGKEMEEITLEKYNLTLTVPKLEKAPEFQNLKFASYDTELSEYDFYISKRVTITEIVEKVFPTDIKMLKEVISSDDRFIGIIEEKELANKAFGIIFKQKASSGKEIKNYLFYFQKDGRYFKMEPVFNNDLKDLDIQLTAFEGMK